MIYFVLTNVPPRNILALTFTRDAANEMKERTEELLKGHLKSRSSSVSRCNPYNKNTTTTADASIGCGNGRYDNDGITVSTFHALCSSILRRYAFSKRAKECFKFCPRDRNNPFKIIQGSERNQVSSN